MTGICDSKPTNGSSENNADALSTIDSGVEFSQRDTRSACDIKIAFAEVKVVGRRSFSL
jgi:hypothetical protein